MKPGPELDALIAEKVIGWSYLKNKEGKWLCKPPRGRVYVDVGEKFVLPYSTSINSAWEVVEKFDAEFIQFFKCGGKWQCCIGIGLVVEADTAPEAICLAALKAVGFQEKD